MQTYRKRDWIPKQFLSASQKTFRGDLEAHSHEFFELEFIIRGTGTYTVNGQDYPIGENTLFFMTPAHFHAIADADMALFNVMFPWNYADLPLPFSAENRERPIVLHPNAADSRLIAALLSEITAVQKEEPGYALDLLRCVLQKISLYVPATEKGTSSYVNRAILYLLENFRTDVTLEGVAEQLGLSKAYFCDLFAKETGIRFKEYLDSLRFSYVCRLLTFTEQPIGEICAASGFGDYANFTRRFKKRYGVTPHNYRRNSREKP